MAAASDSARTALADARATGASIWAPAELQAAEAAHRDALTLQRREETRWWLPDAERVGAAWSAVASASRQAGALAGERRRAAAESARALITDARSAVTGADRLAQTIHLGAERRALLSRAHAAVNEAAVYEQHDDFGTATVRARDALGLVQRVRDHAGAVAARYAEEATVARWRQWRDDTIAWSRRERRAAIVVSKEAHTLTVYESGVATKQYAIDLGFNWIADKLHAGDGATPEGRYRVIERKVRGATIYYKALLLDYPNASDRVEFSRARQSGAVPKTAGIGGLIEIHGEGGRGRDWTQGCVALTNVDIDDLFKRVGVGTPVTIVGSDTHGAIAELAGRPRPDNSRRP